MSKTKTLLGMVACTLLVACASSEEDARHPTELSDTAIVPVRETEFDAQHAKRIAAGQPDAYITRYDIVQELAVPLLAQKHGKCSFVHMVNTRISVRHSCDVQHEADRAHDFASVGDALALLALIFDYTDEDVLTAEKAIEDIAQHIAVPFQEYQIESPITRGQVEDLISRIYVLAMNDDASADVTTYVDESLGFSIQHPSDFRAFFDETSNAVRFQKPDGDDWNTVWSVWRNTKDILKFSTQEGVVAHIHPDDMHPDAVKTVEEELVHIADRFANLVTVTVIQQTGKPWVYTLVFLDVGDAMFEISAGTSDHEGFESFYRSFTLH